MASFDASMKDLLALCRKILKNKSEENTFATKKERKKNVKNPFLKNLDNYSVDYTLNSDDGNKEDVMISYSKYKAALLRGWKNDEWLKNGNVTIYSGAIEPDEKRKIMLSAIYNMACKMRDQTRESLSGLPIEMYADREELLHPTYLLLHMYRLFMYALNGDQYGDEITKLNLTVVELEKELKINKDVNNNNNNTENGDKKSANPFIDGIAGLAQDFVSKMGVQGVDQGAINNVVQGAGLMEAASSIFNRPETRDLLSDFAESMKGSQNIGDALPKILAKFQDPRNMEKIKNMASSIIPPQMMANMAASMNGSTIPVTTTIPTGQEEVLSIEEVNPQ